MAASAGGPFANWHRPTTTARAAACARAGRIDALPTDAVKSTPISEAAGIFDYARQARTVAQRCTISSDASANSALSASVPLISASRFSAAGIMRTAMSCNRRSTNRGRKPVSLARASQPRTLLLVDVRGPWPAASNVRPQQLGQSRGEAFLQPEARKLPGIPQPRGTRRAS